MEEVDMNIDLKWSLEETNNGYHSDDTESLHETDQRL